MGCQTFGCENLQFQIYTFSELSFIFSDAVLFLKPHKLKKGAEGSLEYELNLVKFADVVVILFSEFVNDSIDFGLIVPEKQD